MIMQSLLQTDFLSYPTSWASGIRLWALAAGLTPKRKVKVKVIPRLLEHALRSVHQFIKHVPRQLRAGLLVEFNN